MAVRWFAGLVGLAFLFVGLSGFVPSLGTGRHLPNLVIETHYRDLYGLFPVNVVHNTIHVVVGVAGIISARSYNSATGFSRVLSVSYGALAVMGMVPMLDTTFDLVPVFGHDVWLHALVAIAAGYVGWAVGKDDSDVSVQPDSVETVR